MREKTWKKIIKYIDDNSFGYAMKAFDSRCTFLEGEIRQKLEIILDDEIKRIIEKNIHEKYFDVYIKEKLARLNNNERPNGEVKHDA